ncbi:glycoside hydrolase family 66 protein [Echinicola jeungdonensis]|nr:glycoside hydrolase family 66 protein [Echinicola jeungdonensis]MDN3670669.1 glycoside hydrolase family 66 protein [Echinicola jeungdonensis]
MTGLIGVLLILSLGCNNKEEPRPDSVDKGEQITLDITTNKAKYNPGETIAFRIQGDVPSNSKVSYTLLGKVVEENPLSSKNWEWTAPETDFKGYLVKITRPDENGGEEVLASVGVDVSSDWTRFPRYGFLSKFPQMNEEEVGEVITNLNRYHINGLQFYDWHYQHHRPLAGSAEDPEPVWRDIINREIYFSTVEEYISKAHDRGMKAMFYNLIFGAMKTAEQDGVSPGWFLYTDPNHQQKDLHPLPQPPFVSDIFLLDPSNSSWQDYLIQENQEVYEALPFDGFHMDQLGKRNKALYTYEGNSVQLENTYQPFIEAIKDGHPQKELVLNAVNQYGQDGIGQSETGFLYTEVWGPNDRYEHLAEIIQNNHEYSNGEKNSVLAAYMNYDLADQAGYFNTPAVLLTDAVIFAFGGAHLELGEHMLGKEYFPNNNLQMRKDLKERLVKYYDFMVAYQNLLRDGGSFNDPVVSSYGQVSFGSWPPQAGEVSVVGKEVGDKQVIHLLNFSNATTLNWRDNNGNQAYPQKKENVHVVIQSSKPVQKVWLASPDFNGCSAKELDFKQQGDQVSITLPTLEFWDMLVLE